MKLRPRIVFVPAFLATVGIPAAAQDAPLYTRPFYPGGAKALPDALLAEWGF